jgi:nucleoid DNA-binding protein
MTKAELIEIVAQKAKLTKKASKEAIEAFTGTIEKTLAKGEKVTVSGFGTFVVRKRATRRGRNPQTGEAMQIPATKTPAFIAGTGMKKMVK